VLAGEMYGPLRAESLFGKVQLDDETGTIYWPNGADFDPAILHDWERYRPDLARRAAAWTARAGRAD
jgi:hypothetical protein